ncbi:hypothetical protein EDB86DRAFT_3088950 [Lactarius hatsudake]|nr:hypothetical protein EDB86DRAFT_3088950 [Lactarius hatsudake]
MSTDGLILVARDVPSSSGGLNIALNSVPAGDDYFLLVLNSTHWHHPLASKPTVTLSGGPNPTAQFAATFGSSSGALLSACFISLAMFAGAVAVL